MLQANKIEFIKSLSPANVMQVYSGRDGKCCCGCAGKHSYNSRFLTISSEEHGYDVSDSVNDRMVARVCNLIRANASEASMVDGNHASLVVGARLYVAYFAPAVKITAEML